jgi:hypothetical protein
MIIIKRTKYYFPSSTTLTGKCNLDQLVCFIVGQLLFNHLLSTYVCVCGGGLYIARVSSQKIIAQQVVGYNVHELTKGGSSCEM